MSTDAKVVMVLDQLCSSCLDLGKLTHLWLVRAGVFVLAFCPYCDGSD